MLYQKNKKRKNLAPSPTPPAPRAAHPRCTTQGGGSERRRRRASVRWPSETDLAAAPVGERAATQGADLEARGGGGARGGPRRRSIDGGGGGAAASGRGRSRLKEGRGARVEGGRRGGAWRRWRAGLDLAWIHRENKALPVGSVERKGKEVCEREWGRRRLRAQKGNGNRP